MGGGRRMMEWAARANHMGGIPRKMVILAVGAFAKAVASLLNSTTVHNADTLIHLVRSRPPGVPLLTVSNHMSTLDDPLMWGFRGFPTMDAKLTRWVLTAEDICFRNRVLSYFFRLGQCIPITRGGGIYQEHMNEALDRLSEGAWLHTFPEGKISQAYAPIRRLKWGTASLIARASVTPIVLPIVHHGFQEGKWETRAKVGRFTTSHRKSNDHEIFDCPHRLELAISSVKTFVMDAVGYVDLVNMSTYLSHPIGKMLINDDMYIIDLRASSQIGKWVMPENYLFGRRPPFPLCNKNMKIIIGDPIEFDLPKLRETAVSMSSDLPPSSSGWPCNTCYGLNEAAQKYLYSNISKQIWTVMENLRGLLKTIMNPKH